MRKILTKICLSSSVFLMASCGMFSDEETNAEDAPAVVAEETALVAEETAVGEDAPEVVAETQEVINSEPVVLDDEIDTEEVQRLPSRNDGPHIIMRDGKYWIIAEPSAQISTILNSLGSNIQGLKIESSPAYLRLARELNYRINEMAFNTGASIDDYKELFEKSLQTIEKIAVAEAEATVAANREVIDCENCASICDAEDEIEEEPSAEKENTEVEKELSEEK
ncbi:hypothetical protein PQO03_10905 [Lentisphaera profundi]|uniref:DUF4349 domain-containing protein n=1 Tax=Lentisphaera profundi TaxID=1658616 RepID=A0ABY7VR96_9BACT|nr:hypothetical protein [Lentisphaera profundi]WDE96217.1 hypothetical protein PQO03_10905 [Lentisphaera profundi]